MFNRGRKSPQLPSALQSRMELVLWQCWQMFFPTLGWKLSGTWSLILVVCFFFSLSIYCICLQFPVSVLFTLTPEESAPIAHCLLNNTRRAQNTCCLKAQCLWIRVVLSQFTTWTCLSLQGLEMRQIRFRFDGQPINETDTPSQVSWKAQKQKQIADRSVHDRLELASQPPTWLLAFCYCTSIKYIFTAMAWVKALTFRNIEIYCLCDCLLCKTKP